MKRTAKLIIALSFIFNLTACGDSSDKDKDKKEEVKKEEDKTNDTFKYFAGLGHQCIEFGQDYKDIMFSDEDIAVEFGVEEGSCPDYREEENNGTTSRRNKIAVCRNDIFGAFREVFYSSEEEVVEQQAQQCQDNGGEYRIL